MGRDDVAAHDAEIFDSPYALPTPAHWEKFADAWTNSNYGIYFWNSTIVVVVAVVLVTVIGAMAAHCLARYRFRGNRLVRFLILSGMVLPPQLLILSLFQILLDFGLYNTLPGLVLVYVATQLAMTVYILEGFFAQIPAGPVRCGAHGRLFRFRDLLADHAADRRAGDLHHGDSQLHHPVERVSLCGRA